MEQKSLRDLRRIIMRASPEAVEAAVLKVFDGESPTRIGRLSLYALRRHSSLRPAESARRYGRTGSAITPAPFEKTRYKRRQERTIRMAIELDLYARMLAHPLSRRHASLPLWRAQVPKRGAA